MECFSAIWNMSRKTMEFNLETCFMLLRGELSSWCFMEITFRCLMSPRAGNYVIVKGSQERAKFKRHPINHWAAFSPSTPSRTKHKTLRSFSTINCSKITSFFLLFIRSFAFESTIDIHSETHTKDISRERDKFFQWQTNFPLDEPHKWEKSRRKYSLLNHPNTLRTICYLIDYRQGEIVFNLVCFGCFMVGEGVDGGDFRFLTCKNVSEY